MMTNVIIFMVLRNIGELGFNLSTLIKKSFVVKAVSERFVKLFEEVKRVFHL
jgi:hypothetical protein